MAQPNKAQGWGANDQPVAAGGGYGANDTPVGGAPAQQQEKPGPIRQAIGTAVSDIGAAFNPSTYIQGARTLMHPSSAFAPLPPRQDESQMPQDAFHRVQRALGGGPNNPAERGPQMSIPEVAGHVLSGGAMGATGKLISNAPALNKINPEVATNRVFRPSPADSDFPAVAPEAFSDVKRFGGDTPRTILGNPKVGVNELRRGTGSPSASDTAIQHLQQNGLEPWLNKARQMGVQIPGDEIVGATRKAIPDLMRVRDPQGAARLEAQAQQAFGGRTFTPDQFRDWLRTENGTLQSFYNKSAGAQGAAESAGTPTAIEKAQADAIRDTLYRHLDPEGQGAGPRSIQQRTGNVIDLRNAAERRSNSILGEKPVTPMGALAQPFNAAVKLFKGDPVGAMGTLGHPMRGPSDALISKLYRQVPEGSDLPQPPQFQPRALLGAGPIRMGPVADASGPTGQVPTVNRGIGLNAGSRMLGGASPLQKEPLVTPAPTDTSGPTGTQPTVNRGMGLAGGNRTLGAPTQVPQGGFAVPQTTTEGGRAGITTDMVPVRHPVTGKIEYVPKWTQQEGK